MLAWLSDGLMSGRFDLVSIEFFVFTVGTVITEVYFLIKYAFVVVHGGCNVVEAVCQVLRLSDRFGPDPDTRK